MDMEANRRLSLLGAQSAQPDVILPAQFFEAPRKQRPEQRLMIAVLYDALHCVIKYRCASDREGRRIFREAAGWMLSEETDWPYSFESICQILELDPNAVRQRLAVDGMPPVLPPPQRSFPAS